MSLKFTDEYYPDIDEINAEDLATARQEVVDYLQPIMPDVDLTPGTPTGDLVISPLAAYRASSGVAYDRFMSDLDLANVADGIIFSCDFVRAYLGNFAVYDVENLRATGLVRLTFTSGAARTLARSNRFRFGSEDSWSPRVTNPDASYIQILSAGSSHNGEDDTFVLSQTSSTTWAVDIPLTASMTSPVFSGTSGEATEVSDDLIGIVAATDFISGLPSVSLKELARMAQKAAFSLTSGSRSSTSSLILRHWPETKMVSPVVPGDPEMQRSAAGSPAALQRPAVDVYVRSERDLQLEEQTIRLEYVTRTHDGAKVFRGKVGLLHRPSLLSSLEWSGTTNSSLIDGYSLFSKSSRDDLVGSLHCGSRYEDFYMEVTPFFDGSGTPLVPLTNVEEDGKTKQVAYFTVGYLCDPLLETMSGVLESSDNRPVGVDVLVKSGPLVNLTTCDVYYTAKRGVKTTLTVARESIASYAQAAGYPDPFKATEVYDVMRNAGADRVAEVDIVGVVTVSPATRRLRDTIEDPAGDDLLGDWESESDEMQPLAINRIENVPPNNIVDGAISADGPADAWAATDRTARYFVEEAAVKFIEV